MMTVRENPLPYHRDHLVLIEGIIATTEAAISKQQDKIRYLLAEGGDVVPEVNLMRANWEALKRLKNDRAATLSLIAKHAKSSAPARLGQTPAKTTLERLPTGREK
jgi:hypothetical protein